MTASPSLVVHVDVDRADGRRLLSDVRFELGRGEALQLVGPSGSGKSTLLRQVATLHGWGDGLSLQGQSASELGPRVWRRRVTYSHPGLSFVEATVEAVLQRPFDYAVSTRDFRPESAQADLARLGLKDMLKRDPRDLSSGELQRVALVRTLGHTPDVVLLDEPFAHLDAESRQAALDWLGELRLDGMIVVAASHLPLEMPKLDVGQFIPEPRNA